MVNWQEKRIQEAAAVLGLLINASLMLKPVDVDALNYICATAAFLEVQPCARLWCLHAHHYWLPLL